ncbi:hypothetical protein JIN84_05830 [Luteolibacter yonseiensis]|uniref:PEP-CTERM protein-sorting domain-containing protein n=1 Tax=Luteolibacter yonseiensis TaxID=1144680 RepID=A0A934VAQ6_9BACT|nr:hypothetical protein [Luteolibacter yonseiensis]MBK1815121.1 hypothetical protein [Luteolibacter yonseiensis]
MKKNILVALLLALPVQLQAATVLLPVSNVTATSPDAAVPANADVNLSLAGLANVGVNLTHNTNTVSGAYTATAGGSASVGLILAGTLKLFSNTIIGPSSIQFGTNRSTSGLVGVLGNNILGPIVNAGLTPQWSATIDLGDVGLNLAPSTTYDFTFNLAQTTSLLGNLSPAVLNRFSVSVNDSVGNVPAQVLGLTDLTASNGTARFRFTTGTSVVDPKLRLSASALLDTDLLGSLVGQPNANLYTVSGLNITAIPEPDIIPLMGLFGIILLFRKRQR